MLVDVDEGGAAPGRINVSRLDRPHCTARRGLSVLWLRALQVAKRKMDMLFVRGDGVILVSASCRAMCTASADCAGLRCHRPRERELSKEGFLLVAHLSLRGPPCLLFSVQICQYIFRQQWCFFIFGSQWDDAAQAFFL